MVSSVGHDAKQMDILPGSGLHSKHLGSGGDEIDLNWELAPPSYRNAGLKDDIPGARVCSVCIRYRLIDPVFTPLS